jgi:uncharacterized protein YecE (DUF72 family)
VSGQLDLFALGAPERAGDAVEPAAVSPALESVAAHLPSALYLGTSSWSFPPWDGLVYKRRVDATLLARAGLAAYAQHPLLRTVGIDRTFYAPIPAEAYAGYAAQVPVHFRFLVKAPMACTTPHFHERSGRPPGANPHFLDGNYATDIFVGPCMMGLGEKAGPLVFQFPPMGRGVTAAPARFAEKLVRFLEALPRGPLYAVELRDREVLGAELVRALSDGGARLCIGLHPRMPIAVEQGRLHAALPPGPLVVRWNLRAGRAYEAAKARYYPFTRLVDEDPGNRAALARLCAETVASGQAAYVIANNKAEGSAPLTVFKLAEAIAAAG